MGKAFKKVKKKENGRPLELDEELIKKIANAIRAGAYIETAVAINGVHKSTFYKWAKIATGKWKAGEGEHKPSKKLTELCVALVNAVEVAWEEASMRDILNIDKAAQGTPQEYERYPQGSTDENGRDISGHVMLDGKGNPIVRVFGQRPDWAASAWKLERRASKQWSRTEKIESHNINENSVTVEFVDDEGTDEG